MRDASTRATSPTGATVDAAAAAVPSAPGFVGTLANPLEPASSASGGDGTFDACEADVERSMQRLEVCINAVVWPPAASAPQANESAGAAGEYKLDPAEFVRPSKRNSVDMRASAASAPAAAAAALSTTATAAASNSAAIASPSSSSPSASASCVSAEHRIASALRAHNPAPLRSLLEEVSSLRDEAARLERERTLAMATLGAAASTLRAEKNARRHLQQQLGVPVSSPTVSPRDVSVGPVAGSVHLHKQGSGAARASGHEHLFLTVASGALPLPSPSSKATVATSGASSTLAGASSEASLNPSPAPSPSSSSRHSHTHSMPAMLSSVSTASLLDRQGSGVGVGGSGAGATAGTGAAGDSMTNSPVNAKLNSLALLKAKAKAKALEAAQQVQLSPLEQEEKANNHSHHHPLSPLQHAQHARQTSLTPMQFRSPVSLSPLPTPAGDVAALPASTSAASTPAGRARERIMRTSVAGGDVTDSSRSPSAAGQPHPSHSDKQVKHRRNRSTRLRKPRRLSLPMAPGPYRSRLDDLPPAAAGHRNSDQDAETPEGDADQTEDEYANDAYDEFVDTPASRAAVAGAGAADSTSAAGSSSATPVPEPNKGAKRAGGKHAKRKHKQHVRSLSGAHTLDYQLVEKEFITPQHQYQHQLASSSSATSLQAPSLPELVTAPLLHSTMSLLPQLPHHFVHRKNAAAAAAAAAVSSSDPDPMAPSSSSAATAARLAGLGSGLRSPGALAGSGLALHHSSSHALLSPSYLGSASPPDRDRHFSPSRLQQSFDSSIQPRSLPSTIQRSSPNQVPSPYGSPMGMKLRAPVY